MNGADTRFFSESDRLPHAKSRASALDDIEHNSADLIVVGGGITGTATAALAARAGLRVVLAEAADFAVGTSSRSTKLIHGGIRYLQQFEFRLVGETARERKEVHEMAPHLAVPRWMVLPARNRLELGMYTAAVEIYERLGRVAANDRHEIVNKKKLQNLEPLLAAGRYPWAIAYREYLTDDARLVLALARDAAAHGAIVLNYLRVDSWQFDHALGLGSATVHCGLSKESRTIRAAAIVNACGPWAGIVSKQLSAARSPTLQLSSGIHLVLPAARLPIENLVMLSAVDGRRFFAIRRGDVVHVGTTDRPYNAPPTAWPKIERQDVDYLLTSLAAALKSPVLPRSCVLGAWSGLRPLISHEDDNDTKSMSRSDELFVDEKQHVLTIAGGKLTGFPGMARKTLDGVMSLLRRTYHQHISFGSLPGSMVLTDDSITAFAAAHDISLAATSRLLRLYGSHAEQVLQLGPACLKSHSVAFEGEVAWATNYEGATCLEDIVYRRMRLTVDETPTRDHWHELCRELAMLAACALDWNEAEIQSQCAAVESRVSDDLAACED